MRTKKISIVIVNYNTSNLVHNCVNSIYEYSKRNLFEIIVVDNNSPSDNLDLLRDDNRLTLVELKSNIGFGRANNVGCRYARGEYLLFLNPDILLINDAISILADYLDKNENVSVVGGNLFDSDLKPTHSYRLIFPCILSEIDLSCKRLFSKLFYSKKYEFNHTKNPLNVAYITGADLMVRKKIFDSVGGFDSDFFMYYEETDLCYRIKSRGYIIKSIPDAKLIHLEGKSFVTSIAREERILKGRFLYFHKHYGIIYNIITDLYNISSLLLVSVMMIPFPNYSRKLITRLISYLKIMFTNDWIIQK